MTDKPELKPKANESLGIGDPCPVCGEPLEEENGILTCPPCFEEWKAEVHESNVKAGHYSETGEKA